MTEPSTSATDHAQPSKATTRVIKLGGSLLDLPDLPVRFNRYRKKIIQNNPPQQLLLIVGGGQGADQVRHYNRLFQLGDHHGHWLAIRAMAFNAHCVAHILGDSEIVETPEACREVWQAGKLAVVEPVAWLQALESQGVNLPHRWSFTSDSIAATIALQLQASVLTLLKSTLPDGLADVQKAASLGLVDDDFPKASAGVKRVEMVNLRADEPLPIQVQNEPRPGN